MTYPLASFAYSFQRRLRELAAPDEVYHLQLADIDNTVHLEPPLQVITIPQHLSFSLEKGYFTATGPMPLTKYDVLPSFVIYIHGSSDRFEQNPDNAYDLLQTALSGFTLERTNLVKIRFDRCIVDARLMRYFHHFPSTHQLLIQCQSCIIGENVNINMVSGFNVNLIDCHIQKCFFNGIVEFFNKTATTQNIKIDQSVYAITELLDLKIVNVCLKHFRRNVRKPLRKKNLGQNPKMMHPPQRKPKSQTRAEDDPQFARPGTLIRTEAATKTIAGKAFRWGTSRRCCGATYRQRREEG
uniref:Uncharacterized protein n=1 Tax=Panagrellus redivivus TaxID=6233 RepID=A0A7E4W838_PANRE